MSGFPPSTFERRLPVVLTVAWLGLAAGGTAFAAGSVFAWGDNTCGQTNVPAGLTNVVTVAAGENHNLALKADRTVVAWGCNSFGETNVPPGLSNVVAVAAGGGQSLALRANGTVAAWGDNANSHPFTPGVSWSSIPPGLSNVAAIAAGKNHSLALQTNGTVVAWGLNNGGLTAVPSALSNVVAIAAGENHSLAVKSDGTVIAWPDPSPTVTQNLSNVVAVAVGYHNLALQADGTVIAWSQNSGFGETNVPAGLRNVVAIAAGNGRSLALQADGMVVVWGNETTVPSGLTNVVAIAAGYGHSLALVGTGVPFVTAQPLSRVIYSGKTSFFMSSASGARPLSYQWQFSGINLTAETNAFLLVTNAQIEDSGNYRVVVSNVFGSVTSRVAHLTVIDASPVIVVPPTNRVMFPGGSVSFATLADGSWPLSYQWRKDGVDLTEGSKFAGVHSPELKVSDVQAMDAGNYSVLVSNPFGTLPASSAWLVIQPLVAWGGDHLGQTDVPVELSEVVAIAAGENHNLALKADGAVVAWGYNYFGQSTVPPSLGNMVAVAAGADHSLALRADGEVVAWGGNNYGQTNIPLGLSNVVAIAAGGFHSLALRGDGTVAAWGQNEDGQSMVPSGLTNMVAIAGGWRHSLALKADGTVTAWGENHFEQSTIPSDLTNVVAIAAGGFRSLALKADGTVVGWGDDVAVPSDLTNVVAVVAGGLALRADGTVVGWGNEIEILQGLTNVVAIAAGAYHSLALVGSGIPFVMEQPLSRMTHSGKTSFFRASATRAWPLGYQWQFNGIDLPGATNALLIVTNAQIPDAGGYSVRVGNSSGSTTSRTANFTVINAGPVIVVAPKDQVIFRGGSMTLKTLADGSWPLFYQWRFDGVDLPGATNAQLTVSGVNSNKTGRYAVTVSNLYGTVTSTEALLSLTSIAAWGDNGFGQGSVPFGLSNVVALAGGAVHSVALRADGTVVVWGINDSRQTNLPSGLSEVVAIAAGYYHTLALRADGTVAAWGFGYTNIPPDLSDAVAIAAGFEHSLVLHSDGTVTAWGSNHLPHGPDDIGQATVPEGLSNVVAIAAGLFHSLALRSDGIVVGWGNVTIPSGLSNVIAVAAGADHSLALQADGTVIAWNNDGTLQTDIPSSLTNVIAVTAGAYHNLTLHSNGRVTAWGDNYFNQSSVPSGLANVVMVAAGGYHSLALVGDEFHTTGSPSVTTPLAQTNYSGGSIFLMARASGVAPLTYQWLRNGDAIPGATNTFLSLNGVPSSDSGSYSLMVSNRFGITISRGAPVILLDTPPIITLQPVEVSAFWGDSASLEAQAKGSTPRTYQWRFEGMELAGATNETLALNGLKFAQAGRYSVVVSNAFGIATSSNAVLRLVPVVVWGDQTAVPLRLSNVVAIAAGGYRTLALQADGIVGAWDDSGELLDIPAAASNVTAIAAGGGHSLALRADGTVVGWGYNGSGQTTVPASLTEVVAIAAGGAHSLALRADGVVIAWGDNYRGQTDVPADLDNVAAIAAGSTHSLALRSDGTVVSWGDNVHPIPKVPSGLTNVVAIAAGGEHSLALRSDGTVIGWFNGWSFPYEQMMLVPAGLSNVVAIAAAGEVGGSEAHSLALRADGTVVVWGQSQAGHMVPSGLSNMVQIAAGSRHSVALVGDRPPESGPPFVVLQPSGQTAYLGQTVSLRAQAVGANPLSYQWQFNGSAIPEQTNSSIALSNLQLVHGGIYSLVVTNTWGVTTTRCVLVRVVDAPAFIRVQPAGVVTLQGQTATLKVEANGSWPLAYQWRFEGIELRGATNPVLVLSGLIESQAGRYSVTVSNRLGGIVSADAVLAVVPVAAWGDIHYVPPELRGVVAIAAGAYHNLALKNDGRVFAWGANYFGQIDVPSALTNVVAIAAGTHHSLALKGDGAIVGWGGNWSGPISIPPALTNVVAIAAGGNQSLALKADGTVAAWGGGAAVPAGLGGVVAIAAGDFHCLALLGDGRVVAWGGEASYDAGQTKVPSQLNDVVAIAAGGFHSVALKSDGTVVSWGGGAILPDLSNVAAIAAGFSHNLALTSDGTVVAWGADLYGETMVPTGLSNVVSVAAGRSDSLALIGDGSIALAIQPVTRTVIADSTVRLAAMAVGQRPLTYQWLFNGANIVDATNHILELAGVQINQAGNYSIIVSNALGAVTSRVARLTVLLRPWLEPLPPTTFAPVGGMLTLSANATGTPPLRYQWRKNGVNIPGATNATFTITNARVRDGGSYSVVVANDVGTVTSDPILVIVEVPQQPPGDNFAARVLITGLTNSVGGTNRWATREVGEPYHAGKFGSNSVWYRWVAPSNGIATFRTVGSTFDTLLGIYAGTNVADLTRVAEDEDRGGFFTSELRFNAQTNVDYAIAIDGFVGQQGTFILGWTLEPTDQSLPVITNAPHSQTVRSGDDVVLSVGASGTGLTYQWHFNGAAIAGGNTATLALNNVQAQDVGFYTVAITNSAGRGIESLPAAIEIGPFPGVQAQDKLEDLFAELRPPQPPGPFAPASFVTAFISVAAGSVDDQLFNTTRATTQAGELNHCGVIGGASLWFDFHAENDATVVIDTQGSTFDTVLAVYRKVGFLALATNNVACNTDWRFGAGWSRVMFEAVRGSNYWVVVDGVNPTDLTGRAQLNWAVGRLPQSTIAPVFETLRPGQSRRFWAGVTNAIPSPRFQWLRNGVPILNETNEWLDLTDLQLTDAGRYTVAVSNAVGVVEALIVQLNTPLLTSELKNREGPYRLTLTPVGFSGLSLVLEVSDDLQHWTPVFAHTNANEAVSLNFPLTPANRFFRARPGP